VSLLVVDHEHAEILERAVEHTAAPFQAVHA
jgi:hypothetical protein